MVIPSNKINKKEVNMEELIKELKEI